jgi:hypothetical protein
MTPLCHATLLAAIVAAPAAAETRRFIPSNGVQTFAVRDPVLRVKPGDIVETQTFSKPGDYYDPQTGGPWPGEVGPFYVEGAAPGDTLVVRILKLTPNRDVAISSLRRGGISAVAGDSSTRMLNDPLPERRFVWHIDRQRMVGTLDLPGSSSKRIELPLSPMLGRGSCFAIRCRSPRRLTDLGEPSRDWVTSTSSCGQSFSTS